MIKKLEALVNTENKLLGTEDKIFAHYDARKEFEMYMDAKNANLVDIPEYAKNGIEILIMLEKLGYPMFELGTYIYKDVIEEICFRIRKYKSMEELVNCKELLVELSNAFSSFYLYIARDMRDMGIKSVHCEIENAIARIDEEKIDKDLAVRIFGSDPVDMDYGIQAFQMAAYKCGLYSFEPEFNYRRARSLSNSVING